MDFADANLNGSTGTVTSAANAQHDEHRHHHQQPQQPPPPARRYAAGAGAAPKTMVPTTSGNITTNAGVVVKPKKKPVCRSPSQFALETYFIWFSALIFITELIVDVWLAALYFGRQQPLWGLTTAGVIVVPLGLCQMYSLWLLRTDNLPIGAAALTWHILLLGIPYRYHGILRQVEQGKSHHHQHQHHHHQPQHSQRLQDAAIRHQIGDANAIQTMNATFQYCPQFLFQSFLIVYRKYKCILTGVSAGLAGFAFLWHIFIHFYYLVKRYHDDTDPSVCFDRCYTIAGGGGAANSSAADTSSAAAATHQSPNVAPHIIDNLSTTAVTVTATNGGPHHQHHHHPHHQTTTAHLHTSSASGPSSLISNNLSQTSASLTDSLRNFEKPQYKTDDNNLMSKRAAGSKMVEKCKIFGFNKRRPIYQHEEFDMSGDSNATGGAAATAGGHNASTVFYEIDDSRASETGAGAAGGCSKFNVSLLSNKDMDNFLNENHSNANVMLANKKTMNDYKYKFVGACGGLAANSSDSSNMMLCGGGGGGDEDDMDDLKRPTMQTSAATSMPPMSPEHHHHHHHHHSHHCNHRNSLLKRKGICSSQEMLHLVDIMNDHISAEQVDVLAKSLVELGDVSLPPTESTTEPGDDDLIDHHQVDLDHSALLLDRFPQHLDDRRLLENIDAAIYENQIIFQERIRKNQLTIQNLKLQDQMLSKCIEDMKSCGGVAGLSVAAAAAAAAARAVAGGGAIGGGGGSGVGAGSEILSIRDYENMCFTNISRQQRGMKHWRNYFHDIDTSAHDTSTVQHSSYYVNTNTMSNSTTDLYINEDEQTDDGGAGCDDGGASTVIIHDDDDDDDDDEDGVKGSSCADSVTSSHIVTKKGVRWSSKLAVPQPPPMRGAQQLLRMRTEHFGRRADSTGQSCGGRAAGSETTAISDDLYINMSNHHDDDCVASAISMDASTTTTRGSNSSVVVQLGEDDDEAERDDGEDDEDGEEEAVALPQKNMLVETINKINVDSPVKSLLGGVPPKV